MNTNDRTGGNFIPDPSCFEISDDKFKEMFEAFMKTTDEIVIGKTGFAPTIAIHFRTVQDGMPGDVQGALIVIDCNFNDVDQKREMMRKIGRQCFAKRWILVSVCMAAESWASTIEKDDPKLDRWLPAEDPNRKEVIAIGGRTLMGECKMGCVIPVSRDKDNKFIKGEEPTIITTDIETFILDEILIGFREEIGKYMGLT